MKLSLVLTVSGVYMALVGIGFLIWPIGMTFGVVDDAASAGLIGLIRWPSSLLLAIGLLNLLARNAEASKTRDAIAMANTVGFALGGLLGIWSVISGSAGGVLIIAIVNLLFAGAFFWTGKASMSK